MASWEHDLLVAMAAPADATGNLTALQLWAASEGMPPSENNWLATTEPGFGGRVVNSAGVRAYPSQAAGVAATWATLSGRAYMNVVTAFRDVAGLGAVWAAVNASPWCGGCQSGLYPVALHNALSGRIHIPRPPSSTPPPPPRPHHAGEDRLRSDWAGIGDLFGSWGRARWRQIHDQTQRARNIAT